MSCMLVTNRTSREVVLNSASGLVIRAGQVLLVSSKSLNLARWRRVVGIDVQPAPAYVEESEARTDPEVSELHVEAEERGHADAAPVESAAIMPETATPRPRRRRAKVEKDDG